MSYISLTFAGLIAFVHGLPSVSNIFLRETSTCPFDLPVNGYEFPHLIVPITATQPNLAIGNSLLPSISPDDCATIFNFDIPSSRAEQQCSVYLTIPTREQLVTTDFKFSGPGTFDFVQYAYDSGATNSTTFNTQPPTSGASVRVQNVQPGKSGSWKVWTGDCGPGGVMSWKMSSPDTFFWYFQDFNPCPLGVWIVYEQQPPPAYQPCSSCPSRV